MLRAIRIVREGEYNHRMTLRGNDELVQLAEEFNQLTDRLQTTEEVRRRFVSDASHELKTAGWPPSACSQTLFYRVSILKRDWPESL